MKTVLITGASSGIGYELAKIYGKNSNNLILVARRKERLEILRNEILAVSPDIAVVTVEKDLEKENASVELFEHIKNLGLEVDILINNAGFGIYGKFSDLTEEEMDRNDKMINLNVKALVELTKLYLNEFLKKNSGGILNVSSIAAFTPGPLMANYYAGKAYILSFTEALREEMTGTGIKIAALCPGPTETEFEKSPTVNRKNLYSRLKVMTPEKVAETAYRDFEKGKSVIIPGYMNKIIALSIRFLPRKLLTRLARKIQEKK